MAIELAGITLNRIHHLSTQEQADFTSHRVPGLEGNLVQNMGRHSVRLRLEGIFYGVTAKDDLESLREVYKDRKPVDFLADIVGQAYFAEVLLERFEVRQSSAEPEQFSYQLYIIEYVPPPQPAGLPELGADLDIDADLGLEALDFMTALELPDLFSLPELTNPTEPLSGIPESLAGVWTPLSEPAEDLGKYFEGGSNARSFGRSNTMRVTVSGSLFDGVSGALDENTILNFIGEQVGVLTGAGDQVQNLFNNPPSEIGDIGDFLTDLDLPEDGLSQPLQAGLSKIKNLLPTDTSGIIGNLSNGLEDFFTNLNTDLTDKIASIFQGYQTLQSLADFIKDASNEEETAAENAEFRSLARMVVGRNVRSHSDGGIFAEPIQALQEFSIMLEVIPDPLTVVNLFKWIEQGVNFPKRDTIPLRYLPLVDELKNKLQTVLQWDEMTVAELENHLTESIKKVAEAIDYNFYAVGVNGFTEQIVGVTSQINAESLQNTLEQTQQLLNDLTAAVNAGDLTGTMPDIEALADQKDILAATLRNLQEQFLAEKADEMSLQLSRFGDELESRMFQLIGNLNPASDLDLLGYLARPLESALEDAGLENVTTAIQDGVGKLTDLINKLNLSSIRQTMEEVIGGASGGVNDLRDLLMQATVEITVLLNRIENAIEQIQAERLINEMKAALEDFQKLIEENILALFAPIRNLLLALVEALQEILEKFNPAHFVKELQEMLQNVTNLLSDPQLLHAIEQIKNGFNEVNGELEGFSFKNITDVVVDAINIVEDALEIALKIPMPDSLKSDFKSALGQVPKKEKVKHAIQVILTEMDNLIEEGPKPVLEEIRDKPRELVELVEGFSPADYIGENLTKPYQDFLKTFEGNTPSKLLEPVQQELDKLKTTVSNTLNPEPLLAPLQTPFDEIIGFFKDFDPAVLIAPLQEKLTEGIHLVTDNLPLETTEDIFDGIEEVNHFFEQIIEMGTAIRDMLNDIKSRVGGLENAEQQVHDFGQNIAGKLNGVNDIDTILTELQNLENKVPQLTATALQTDILSVVDVLVQQLQTLQPQQRLIDLISAQRGFPMSALDALSDSAEKVALKSLIENFDPLNEIYSLPLQKLEDWQQDLAISKTDFQNTFANWDTQFHSANSPLNALKMGNATLTDIRQMLSETIEKQLTEALAPFFKVVDYLQEFTNVILVELDDLIATLQNQLSQLTQIGDAFATLETAINDLISTLENFDITFLEREIREIFEAVQAQIEVLNPSEIAKLLKNQLDKLLDILNLNALLGTAELDKGYLTLVDTLKTQDPTKALAEAAQEEYDKIPAFLKRLDLSEQINKFLELIDKLQNELDTELNRVADEYGEMIETVPGEFQASVGVHIG